MVSPDEKCTKPILVNACPAGSDILMIHVKYLFEHKRVPKVSTVHTCSDDLPTPNTCAVIDSRPDFGDHFY